MPDICVIMNAGSGKRRGVKLAEELHRQFERFPGRFVLRVVTRGREIGPAAQRAAGEGFRTIVAAGGDGTINAVVAELLGSDCQLGILPLGTFNYAARSLGIPLELDKAVAVLAEGRARAIDLGDVNGKIFLNNASLGAYAAILVLREQVYRRWGRSRVAAYWSVLRALLGYRSSLALRVMVNGMVRRYRTPMVFVANNEFQLARYRLEGGACIADWKLALYVAPDCGRLGLIGLAVGLALGRLRSERDFELLCGDDIVVETSRRWRTVVRDGERQRLPGPFRFSVRPGAVRVMVPPEP